MNRFYIIVVCLVNQICFGQEPLYVSLGDTKNLPNKTIYDVVEDKKQLIWLATEVGIYKYNSIDFEFYSHPEQVGLSVFSLSLDDQNTLWYNNLANQLFFIKDEQQPQLFYDLNITFKGENTSIVNYKNLIIITGNKKLIILDKNSKKICYSYTSKKRYIPVKPIVKGDRLIIVIDNTNYIKVNLNTFEAQKSGKKTSTKTTENYLSGTGFLDENNNPIIVLNAAKRNGAFIFKNNKVFSLNIEGSLTNKRIISSTIYNQELWLCAEDGLYIYEITAKALRLKQHYFKNKLITKTIKDTFDNYWVSTHDDGIFIIPNIAFKGIDLNKLNTTIKEHYNGYDAFYLQSLNNVLYTFDTDTNNLQTALQDFKYEIKYVFKNPFTNTIHINTLEKDISSFDDTFNPLSEQNFLSVIKNTTHINATTFLASFNTNSGIYSNSHNTDLFAEKRYLRKGRSYSNTYNNISKTGYFANIDGLFAVDSTLKETEIRNNENKIYAKQLISDDTNTIWVLKFKNGILKLDTKGRITDELNTNNGLLSQINTHIYSYKNQLWILGNAGIQVYNTKTESFKNITKRDGVPSYDFKGIYIEDDVAYITTSNSIFFFNINDFKKIAKTPKPYFTKLSVNGKTYVIDSTLTLPTDTNKIELFFNTNGLFSQETIAYQYQLNNNSWETVTSGTNSISFNRISAGKYNLKVRAIQDKVMSQNLAFDFVIPIPFYKHWLFTVFLLLLFIIVVWLFYKTKNRRIKANQKLNLEKKNQELENINLKLENLRSQMNPHFVFNALNSIQDYILKNETKLARHFLVKFSRLIRIYLEHSQNDSITLHEEIEALTLYLDLERDRFSNSLQYTIDVVKDTDTHQTMIPAFLIQPYVENSIKHGLLHIKGEKKLNIKFNITDNTLQCCIIDNGIGREKSRIINLKKNSHQSFSSSANEKRIELLNTSRVNKIKIEINDLYKDNKASGTEVILKIPKS